jgi:type II secretory pathway component PulC
MSNIFDNYLVKLIKQNKSSSLITPKLTENNNLLLLHTIYTTYIKNTVLKFSSTPEYVDKLTTLGIQGIVFSSPKKQMYAVIINKLPALIFSAGLMRLAMNLEAKCSKKSKIVIVNSLKFI